MWDSPNSELLFHQAVYLWETPSGRRRLFEIVNVLTPTQLAVVAAPGEIATDTIFHIIRGDDPLFGMKDTLTIFAYFSASDTTVLELSDLRDRSVGGTVSAAALVGARLAPNPRFPQRTFEITGYGYRLADGVVQLYVKGDLTGELALDAPIFIYAKSLPLSPIGFAGYYWDGETGLNYAWNRFQSPNTGRWLTRDPAGYMDAIHLYHYVSSNPMTLADTRGLQPYRFRFEDCTPSQVETLRLQHFSLCETLKCMNEKANVLWLAIKDFAYQRDRAREKSTNDRELSREQWEQSERGTWYPYSSAAGDLINPEELQRLTLGEGKLTPELTKLFTQGTLSYRYFMALAPLLSKMKETLCPASSDPVITYECECECGWPHRNDDAYTSVPDIWLGRKRIHLCPRFFSQHSQYQTVTLVHEAGHLFLDVLPPHRYGEILPYSYVLADDIDHLVENLGCAR